MAKTFLDQGQTRNTGLGEYDDTLPLDVGLETNATDLRFDANAIRSVLRAHGGADHWYAKPPKSLADLTTLTSEQGVSIADLQTLTASQGQSIAGLDALTASQGATIAEHTTEIAGLTVELGKLDGRVSVLESTVSGQGQTIATHTAEIAALDGRVTTNEASITNLDATTAAQSVAISERVKIAGGDTMTGTLSFDAKAMTALDVKSSSTAAVRILDSNNIAFFNANATTREIELLSDNGIGHLSADAAGINVTNSSTGGTTTIGAGSASVTSAPTGPYDVVNKLAMDAALNGLKLHPPVKASALDVAPAPSVSPTVDGVTITLGERIAILGSGVDTGIRVLAKDGQGVYFWDFPADWVAGTDASGATFFVQQGDDRKDTSWVQTADPAVIGVNDLAWAQSYGPGTYLPGAGIAISGTTISVANDGIVAYMISAGAVENVALAGGIELTKLAELVYTQAQTDTLLAERLALGSSLNTMTKSGATIAFADAGRISGLADLTENSPPGDAVNNATLKAAIENLDSISSKTFAVVQKNVGAGLPVFGGPGGNLDASFPAIYGDFATFAKLCSVNVNGALQRPGAGFDVVTTQQNPNALVFDYNLRVGDTIFLQILA